MTCHELYLRWVVGAMESIDAQNPGFAERVLALDDCPPPAPRDGWTYVTGNWHSAAGALNAGMQRTSTPWLICWDADNVMPDGYLAAMIAEIEAAPHDVAMIYPDLHFVDEQLRSLELEVQMEWGYWSSRIENPVDTAAAWRREAIDLAGSWTEESLLDDFSLALRLSAAGWRGKRCNGPPVIMRRHPAGVMQSLRRKSALAYELWKTYSVAVITPFRGSIPRLDRWIAQMLRAELPYRIRFHLVSLTSDRKFVHTLVSHAETLAAHRTGSNVDISVLPPPASTVARDEALEAYPYAVTMGRVTEDLLLTLDESLVVPSSGFRLLGEEMCRDTRRHGGVAALQPHPALPGRIDASVSVDGEPLSEADLPSQPVDVAVAGGGCMLWSRWLLDRMPVRTSHGTWSRALCHDVQQRGAVIRLHPAVRCRRDAIPTDYSRARSYEWSATTAQSPIRQTVPSPLHRSSRKVALRRQVTNRCVFETHEALQSRLLLLPVAYRANGFRWRARDSRVDVTHRSPSRPWRTHFRARRWRADAPSGPA
jgi:hypothetical protein